MAWPLRGQETVTHGESDAHQCRCLQGVAPQALQYTRAAALFSVPTKRTVCMSWSCCYKANGRKCRLAAIGASQHLTQLKEAGVVQDPPQGAEQLLFLPVARGGLSAGGDARAGAC
jgi:hypothetical protein